MFMFTLDFTKFVITLILWASFQSTKADGWILLTGRSNLVKDLGMTLRILHVMSVECYCNCSFVHRESD